LRSGFFASSDMDMVSSFSGDQVAGVNDGHPAVGGTRHRNSGIADADAALSWHPLRGRVHHAAFNSSIVLALAVMIFALPGRVSTHGC